MPIRVKYNPKVKFPGTDATGPKKKKKKVGSKTKNRAGMGKIGKTMKTMPKRRKSDIKAASKLIMGIEGKHRAGMGKTTKRKKG